MKAMWLNELPCNIDLKEMKHAKPRTQIHHHSTINTLPSSILLKQIWQSRTSFGDHGTMSASIIYKETGSPEETLLKGGKHRVD